MKHKHADLMALYAQDAQETDTPWERWEYNADNEWAECSHSPMWGERTEYRRKPEPPKPREWELVTPDGSSDLIAYRVAPTYYKQKIRVREILD